MNNDDDDREGKIKKMYKSTGGRRCTTPTVPINFFSHGDGFVSFISLISRETPRDNRIRSLL